MCQVPIVERDQIGLEERVAEAPAEERAEARRVGGHDAARDAGVRIAGALLRDEVARVDGEELPADLERKRMRAVAGERRKRVGVCGESGRDGAEDLGYDVVWAANEGVALGMDVQRCEKALRTGTHGINEGVHEGCGYTIGCDGRVSQRLAVKIDIPYRDFPASARMCQSPVIYAISTPITHRGYVSFEAKVGA